ncbi:hypothetical protein M8C21_033248 [Ambrosia artemisiifolia]|jgi:hypothetical protein
MSEV